MTFCPEGFNMINMGKHYHYECKKCGATFCEDDVVWAYHSCRFTVKIWVDCDNEHILQSIILTALNKAKEDGQIRDFDYTNIGSEED
jgi:hypothetical protein